MRIGIFVAFGLVFGVCAAAARAENILLLEDGRIVERPKMERVEGAVRVFFENGEVVIPDALIQEAILEGVHVFEPKDDKERAKYEKGLVNFQGEWVKKEKLPEFVAKYLAERKARIQEIKEHQEWRNKWEEKTKHFEFQYTVPPHIFEYYRDLMEAYYKEFAKTWKVKQPKDLGRLTVCFYTDVQKFQQIGGAPSGVLGYFRFVKPIELNFYYDRLDPEGTEQVMYHEANHYLQMLMNPAFSMPHFPGEAIAEYYGASKFDPETGKLETGQVLEGRLAEIKMQVLAGDMMDLEKMITTDGMYEHYNWGWSLAHFLMNDPRYRKKFEKFVKDLADGKGVRVVPYTGNLTTVPTDEVWAHFKRTFGLKTDEDVVEFQGQWHAYVKDGLDFVSSRGLEQAARRAAGLGMPIKAKRLYKEAIDAGTKSAITYHRYAELLDGSGSGAEALQYYRKAVELAPLEASFYGDLGHALYRQGQKEEGLALARLALELDPDNFMLAWELDWLKKAEEG